MEVTQAGSQVTVALTYTLAGESEEGPELTGTLTAAGVLNIPTFTEEDEDCGTFAAESLSTSFSGNSMRFDWIFSSTDCGNSELRGTLTR